MRRAQHTLETKVKAIEAVDKGHQKKLVAAHFGVLPNTLSTWLKQKAKLQELLSKSQLEPTRKRLRMAQYEDVETALLQWFKAAKTEKVKFTGPQLQSKAEEFATQLGHPDFKCSSGWLERFKDRHCLNFKVNHAPEVRLSQLDSSKEEDEPSEGVTLSTRVRNLDQELRATKAELRETKELLENREKQCWKLSESNAELLHRNMYLEWRLREASNDEKPLTMSTHVGVQTEDTADIAWSNDDQLAYYKSYYAWAAAATASVAAASVSAAPDESSKNGEQSDAKKVGDLGEDGMPVWDVSKDQDSEQPSSSQSIAEGLKVAATEVLQESGVVYDEKSGLYYDYNSGYYFDPDRSLYYEPHSGTYYYYDQEDQTYKFHSQVDLSEYSQPETEANVGRRTSSKRSSAKKSKEKAERQKKELIHEAVKHLGNRKERRKAARKLEKQLEKEKKFRKTHQTQNGEDTGRQKRKSDRKRSTGVEWKGIRHRHGSRDGVDGRKSHSRSSRRCGDISAEDHRPMDIKDSQSRGVDADGSSDTFRKICNHVNAGSTLGVRIKEEVQEEGEIEDQQPEDLSIKDTSSSHDRLNGYTAEGTSTAGCDKCKAEGEEGAKTASKARSCRDRASLPLNGETQEDSESEIEEGEVIDDEDEEEEEEMEASEEEEEEEEETGEDSEEVSSSEEDQEEEESAAVHYAPCIRAMVSRSDVLDVGSLYVLTCSGGTIGREPCPSHAICIADCNISKMHAGIEYRSDLKKYVVKDFGSQNGTFLNGHRLAESKTPSESFGLSHGDLLMFGGTTLELHIHAGTDTCDGCEPGLVRAGSREQGGDVSRQAGTMLDSFLTKAEKEKRRRQELKQIKKKFGLEKEAYQDSTGVVNNPAYEDKAAERRRTKGSDNPYQPDEGPASVDSPIPETNKGHKMLEKMGWKGGSGLGRQEQGRSEPVRAEIRRRPTAGLGASGAAVSLDDAPYRPMSEKWFKAQQRFNQLTEGETRAATSASAKTEARPATGAPSSGIKEKQPTWLKGETLEST